MQRYHATNCTSAVNNSALSGSARDNSRVDSSSIPPNYSLNPRRSLQLTSYKLRCDKESLNSRLGPPDFHPQSPNCPEETLTREYVLSGYKETVEGLEEAREISLSQVQTFTKPVIVKCKEALRKYHRAINESRGQKRKAGQVYGVPLSGTLLTKPGIPEQRPCSEDFRKKWIEGLSQQHKRLCSLADHVPHGYRRKSLFEVLIRNNVPLLKATWFIKITYLNQVRPGSSSLSSGWPDKTQITRSEQWTKDIVDYLQALLDESISRNSYQSTVNIRDRSPQMGYTGSAQQRGDGSSMAGDGEEPSLHFKWWYVVRILQWHHAEGLIVPSLIIDWVFNQLQEKELLGVLQLLLPVIYGVIEAVVLCQTYVRTLVGIAICFIQEPAPGGSDLVDNSRRAYTTSALVEMLRYLILAVPDTFVALDIFPLPSCVVAHVINDGNFLLKAGEESGKIKRGPAEVTCFQRDKGTELQHESLSIDRVVSSIQKRTEYLSRGARPGHLGQNVAKALQVLDRSLVYGNLREAYKLLFENLCDGAVDECWITEVSSCLRTTLKHIEAVTLSFISSILLICEWATCDFRDFRIAPPSGQRFTGRKDVAQIYIAVRLLKLKKREMQRSSPCKVQTTVGIDNLAKDPNQLNKNPTRVSVGNAYDVIHVSKSGKNKDLSNAFESPSSLHDIIVCWIDQHQVQSGEGIKRLQVLLIELIQAGIFYPQAYVRQLLVSGIMDGNGAPVDQERRRRHYRVLKHFPGPHIRDALGEAHIAEGSVLSELMDIYSNERRIVLHGLLDHHKGSGGASSSLRKQKFCHTSGGDAASPTSVDQWRSQLGSSLTAKSDDRIEELKSSISALLQFPTSSLSSDTGVVDSVGSAKRSSVSSGNKIDIGEGTPGCEECRRMKKQKLNEDRSSYIHGYSPSYIDEDDIWWVRKGQKLIEPYKVDPPPKPAKQGGRGRQKVVRKTQSLAQLATARIEGSQGASTSHVCDSRVNCPHHKTGAEGDVPKSVDGIRVPCNGDVVSIREELKQMRFVEKRTTMVWLVGVVKQLVEDAEKTATKVGQYGIPFSAADDRNSVRWKLGEDELSTILYLMDVSDDLVSAVRFLLWLLPKVLSNPASSVHGGRNILMLPRNSDNVVCEVGEAFVISCFQRYESIIIAADLIPDTLKAAMQRVAATMASTGRISGSSALVYARHLMKKFGNVVSVVEWEKNFKSSYDKRLTSELDSGRLSDGEFGFPLGVPAGVEDLDDFFRQKISGVRVSRVGLTMRDIVQRKIDEVFHYFNGKERKIYGSGAIKSPGLDKLDGGYQIAQQIVMGLMDCMRQTGGAAQEGDPSLVSSAISAIVGNVGSVIAKIPDLSAVNNHLNVQSTPSPWVFARRILRLHVICLCLLKDALGERQSRVFEVALATEASNALAQAFVPGKAPRGQFQQSPESHDSSSNSSYDALTNSSKAVFGRTVKITGAISALVLGAILQGVTSLERMVMLFRLREGLDPIQFVRSIKSNSNGNARSIGVSKQDGFVEVSAHWFRVLVGNCRTVSDGFILELLGEASVVGLSRMQRTLPLNLVFPPAYRVFAFLIWKDFIFSSGIGTRDDIPQLYQSLALAMADAIKHLPFREICLRNTHGLYDLIAADTLDSEFAALLESNGLDMPLKATTFVPLRARLFLNSLIDCKLPQSVLKPDDDNRLFGHGESKVHLMASPYLEKEAKLEEKIVHVLDTLQPAKFHWQWVELRLLLNEQAVIEKLGSHDTSLVEAMRSVSPNPDKVAASENENKFVEIILTRLLVRPDAASLFSEVVHLFGRSLEDSMLLQAKWFLGGNDVLYGRKSIHQRLTNITESKGLSTKSQYWKPWGWCYSASDSVKTREKKRKFEVMSIEEGEVVDEVVDLKGPGKGSSQAADVDSFLVSQQHLTERAFIELILPCVDQGSDESRNTFAGDMIKQMNYIEQQINSVTRGVTKPVGSISSGIDSPTSKSNSRKGMRGGSPGLPRRSTVAAEIVPPSPLALRASMSLRLQFLLRLLPIICSDGEPSGRNMRHTLASVILRLLGSRVVHEDAGHSFSSSLNSSKREVESLMEASATASVVIFGESLFDRLLLVLHGLLSSSRPSWLKSKSGSKLASESGKDFSMFDRDVAENLQNELDRMQLPDPIRWRIQSAMPVLLPSVRCLISCQPPSVSSASLAALLPSNQISALQPSNSVPSQKNQGSLVRAVTNVAGRTKPPLQESDMEVDPWNLLEDGAGSQSSSNAASVGGSDHANLKASNWLKGAVRVRRTDLTYVGAIDEDS